MRLNSAVQEVGCHEELQSDLWGDGELRDLSGAVSVASLVCKIHAYFLKNMRRNLTECRWRKDFDSNKFKIYNCFLIDS